MKRKTYEICSKLVHQNNSVFIVNFKHTSDLFLNVSIAECKQVNVYWIASNTCQPAFTCSKLTIETLKQGVKYVQS